MPRVVTLGRAFDLVPDAVWYNPARRPVDGPVTAADVRATVERLRGRRNRPGAEVGEWLDRVTAKRPAALRVTLRQGYLDPLVAHDFKVLPEKFVGDPRLRREPGRQRAVLLRRPEARGRPQLRRLQGEPVYGKRASRTNLPRLAEVALLSRPTAVARLAFRRGRPICVIESNTTELVG